MILILIIFVEIVLDLAVTNSLFKFKPSSSNPPAAKEARRCSEARVWGQVAHLARVPQLRQRQPAAGRDFLIIRVFSILFFSYLFL